MLGVAEVAVVEDAGKVALEFLGVAPFRDVVYWADEELDWFTDSKAPIEDSAPFVLISKIASLVEDVTSPVDVVAVVDRVAKAAVFELVSRVD